MPANREMDKRIMLHGGILNSHEKAWQPLPTTIHAHLIVDTMPGVRNAAQNESIYVLLERGKYQF